MKFLVLWMCLLVVPLAHAEVAGADAALLKQCETRVDQALVAYNAKSWKDFFKDFAKASAALCTEASFNSVYVNTAQRDYGTYESRTLDEGKSTFNKSVGLLIYKAKFSKKTSTLSVNFLNEGGDWKIQQLRIDP